MKAKIFIDWEDRIVLTEKEKTKWIENKTLDLMEDETLFADFLEYEKYMTIVDVYNLTNFDKVEIEKDFAVSCEEQAKYEFQDRFEEKEIEL